MSAMALNVFTHIIEACEMQRIKQKLLQKIFKKVLFGGKVTGFHFFFQAPSILSSI